MNEYIIRETGYPGTLKTEIVGELVRCKDCKVKDEERCPWWHGVPEDEFYCAWGERKDI